VEDSDDEDHDDNRPMMKPRWIPNISLSFPWVRGILPERFLLTRLRMSRERDVNINLTGKIGKHLRQGEREEERLFM